ncbi:hypothetical protein PsAD2_02690 [Pseudovibrio axinellae]|uniref:Uncharacterized protein n=1 Tax=Pseudovibrio axinellae TaxID=989403 RepID=A0A165XR14_9HYPH|nr:hypothetical protein [Pseudovibrio axinellae]KZL17957.1 hypothetical protein PsAD2_02690 [Pseudovibrio axinellae]SER15351.1 hypothetical protein SAMN05421798_106290 [Pseudovibrio axinellae]
MKRSGVIGKLFWGLCASVYLSGAAFAQVCPTDDTMKTGMVMINNQIPARLLVRLDDHGQVTELHLDERYVVVRDQIHVHERGLFLSYERGAHINRTYVPDVPFSEFFPLEVGKVWSASVNVFENEVLVRSDVPYTFSVGEPNRLQVGRCAYDVLEITMETVTTEGKPLTTKYSYSPELGTILKGEGEHLWTSENGVMQFDELWAVRKAS